MIYLSIAIVLSTLIIQQKGINITFHKIMEVRSEQHNTPTQEPMQTETELAKEQPLDKPPSLDDLIATLNEFTYDLGGDINE